MTEKQKTPEEVLFQYQEALKELEVLEKQVEETLKRLGMYGDNPTRWKENCQEKAIRQITNAIVQGRNLPVNEDKIFRIIKSEHPHYLSQGEWLRRMTPEKLQAFIVENVGDPIQTEINNTLDNIFPKHLRNKDQVFNDQKQMISRYITTFETWIDGKMKIPFSFKPKEMEAFLMLSEHYATGIPFEEITMQFPLFLDRDQTFERSHLYKKWDMPYQGIISIRPMVDGKWKFELSPKAYACMKAEAQKRFTKAEIY